MKYSNVNLPKYLYLLFSKIAIKNNIATLDALLKSHLSEYNSKKLIIKLG